MARFLNFNRYVGFYFRRVLKGPSQPPPFSMPSKLLMLHGATKSYCFTVRCVPGSV